MASEQQQSRRVGLMVGESAEESRKKKGKKQAVMSSKCGVNT